MPTPASPRIDRDEPARKGLAAIGMLMAGGMTAFALVLAAPRELVETATRSAPVAGVALEAPELGAPELGAADGAAAAEADALPAPLAEAQSAPSGFPSPTPGLAQPAGDQTQLPGAAPQMGVELVVGFKDPKLVKPICDLFWRDQAAARTRFESFRAQNPAFADLRLDRATYSNELVLVPVGRLPPAERMPAMRKLAARLSALPIVAYAEPNMTALPGDKR